MILLQNLKLINVIYVQTFCSYCYSQLLLRIIINSVRIFFKDKVSYCKIFLRLKIILRFFKL